MDRIRLIPLVLALACGGAGAAWARPAIVDGSPTSGDPSVVAIVDPDGAPFCTGALIAPRVVLTAAHCVAGRRVADRVFFGEEVARGGLEREIAWAEPHPDHDPATLAADVALLRLAEDAPGAPLPLSRSPIPGDWIGRELRFVGFGQEGDPSSGGAGTKRQVSQAILAIGADDLTYDAATCLGDSGGPALARVGDQEVVVGVVSSGSPGCRHYGRAARVDAHARWIDERLEADAPPGACAMSGAASPSGAATAFLLLTLAARPRRRRRSSSGRALLRPRSD